MNSTKNIVAKIGPDRFEKMLGVGRKSVARALTKNRFTASWFGPICEELADMGEVEPPRDLFNFKDRVGKRPKA